MPPNPPQITLSTPAEAQNLAKSLATDDAFRARFQENPQQVLAEFGLAVSSAQLPTTVTLPSKEKFVEGMIALTGQDPRSLNPTAAIEDAHWAFLAFLAFL